MRPIEIGKKFDESSFRRLEETQPPEILGWGKGAGIRRGGVSGGGERGLYINRKKTFGRLVGRAFLYGRKHARRVRGGFQRGKMAGRGVSGGGATFCDWRGAGTALFLWVGVAGTRAALGKIRARFPGVWPGRGAGKRRGDKVRRA